MTEGPRPFWVRRVEVMPMGSLLVALLLVRSSYGIPLSLV